MTKRKTPSRAPTRYTNVNFENPTCVECGAVSVLTAGAKLFPTNRHQHGRVFFVCPCGAWTTCHDGTALPKGRPGNQVTRQLRWEAHQVFDPIWQRKSGKKGHAPNEARQRAYRWLGAQLGLDALECHIGRMDADMCRRVIELCSERARRAA